MCFNYKKTLSKRARQPSGLANNNDNNKEIIAALLHQVAYLSQCSLGFMRADSSLMLVKVENKRTNAAHKLRSQFDRTAVFRK